MPVSSKDGERGKTRKDERNPARATAWFIQAGELTIGTGRRQTPHLVTKGWPGDLQLATIPPFLVFSLRVDSNALFSVV